MFSNIFILKRWNIIEVFLYVIKGSGIFVVGIEVVIIVMFRIVCMVIMFVMLNVKSVLNLLGLFSVIIIFFYIKSINRIIINIVLINSSFLYKIENIKFVWGLGMYSSFCLFWLSFMLKSLLELIVYSDWIIWYFLFVGFVYGLKSVWIFLILYCFFVVR